MTSSSSRGAGAKFDKVAREFCDRAAVEGNLKTWDGKDVFLKRCYERVVRSLEAVEKNLAKQRRR
ncbi:MAG: hypothetical protein WC969_15510 [Elusimicrobiota bacterium]